MTTRKITPFLFEGEITVRVIDKNGTPWFVATDVCRALGLVNPAETVRSLDEDEKCISSADILGGHQEHIIVSESGLYNLIFKSRKPDAARFRKWVTSEVLPAIRRTGEYSNKTTEKPQNKPYDEWSLEEKRVAISQVRAAAEALNPASAAWLWEHLGLPMPPRYLLPSWHQIGLFGDETGPMRA